MRSTFLYAPATIGRAQKAAATRSTPPKRASG
jgi:hypothetical protein